MHLEPASGENASPASPAETPRQNPIHPEQPAAPRTGPLRNGNRRGNPNAAPRCGAKTRSGCPCRAPAIRGKLRCRMHGGASTGPRTAEGLERLRAARTTHGRTTAAARRLHRFRLTFLRRGRVQLAAYQQEARLPPAAQARLHALPPELAMLPYPSPDQPLPSRAEERAIATAEAEALAPWKLAIALARASRHTGGLPPAAARGIRRRLPAPAAGARAAVAAAAHAP